MKTEYLILGASFFGAGFALKNKGKCVILEEGATVGKEFISSFNQKKPREILCKTELGDAFKIDLKKRGLLNKNGEIYAGPATFLLSEILLKSEAEVYFDTVVTKIEKINSEFKVTFLNIDGENQIFAKKIIDTTSFGAFNTLKRDTYFGAVAECGDIKNEITNLEFSYVKFEGDYMLARNNLLKKGGKIIMFANSPCCFDGVYPSENEGFLSAPSDGFYNLLEAFDGGALWS